MASFLLDIEPHKVSRDLSGYIMLVYGPAKIGKAQPVSTSIPVPSGYKKLGDIQVGDYVYNEEGEPVKVLGVYPQGQLDVYKATFEDGRVSYCNDEHIWSVYTSRGNLKDITVKEMLEKGVWEPAANSSKRTARYSIPMNKAVQKDEKEYKIPPYVIGAFLGDGCCKNRQLTISSNDIEIVNHIAELIGNVTPRKQTDKNYNWQFVIDEDKRVKNSGGVEIKNVQTKTFFEGYEDYIIQDSNNKRIPPEYFEGSIEQRYELLQGLMDTDGSISKDAGSVLFTSVNKDLINDVATIARSLGYRVSIRVDKRAEKYTNEAGECYSLAFNIPNNEKYKLFYLKRKKDVALSFKDIKKARKYNQIKIHDIEKMPYQEEMVCIYVDSPKHLYLTEDYIVTHNTTFGSNFPKSLILAFERGYNSLPGVRPIDITTWGEFKKVVRELKKPEVKEAYSSLIVDTADVAADLCQKYICSQLGIDNMGDGGWANNSWSKYKKEFEETFRSLAQLGYAIVFISHDKEKTIKPQNNDEYQQITSSMQSSALSIIENMCDIITYAHSKKMPDGSFQRVLTLRSPDDSIRCGTRFKYMDNEVPFNYQALTDALNRAIDKEAEMNNNLYVTDEKNSEIHTAHYDYDALMDELQNMISDLMQKDQSNAMKITSTIDKYLGKGKKVVDTTPEQAEFISLIIDELKDIFNL